MSGAAFTIHDYIEHLVAGGVPKAQAEAIASANARLREAERAGDDGLMTRKDGEILLARIETAIADAKTDTLKTVFMMLFGFAGVIIAAVKLL